VETIDLGHGIQLPLSELDFSFTRSSGPGGQHVNRAETKVELRWDVANSPSINDVQRAMLLRALGTYVTEEGILILTSGETRSQHRNREVVIARLQALVNQAMRPRRTRHATRPSTSARATRLQKKKRHGEKKSQRGKVNPTDYD
jgi:ribosome-associated protein